MVVVPDARDQVDEQDGARWYRLRGPRIPTQHPYRALLRQGALERIIQHERPSIVEIGSPYLVPWLVHRATRARGIPRVWFFHTNFPRIIAPRPGRDAWPRAGLARLAERYVARLHPLMDAAVAASASAVRLLERAGFQRVFRVPLGVDLQTFHPRNRARRAATRLRHGLPETPLVLVVGRLAREKELGLVLDAWPRVEHTTQATLVLVGDGPSRRHFQDRCRARRVCWIPYQTDRALLADLLAAADLVVAPGPAETFGLAALEALASGTPLLTSDAGAVRELVEGSTAGMVNPEPTPESMARTLVTMLEDGPDQRRAAAREVAERYSWDATFDALLKAYAEVMGG